MYNIKMWHYSLTIRRGEDCGLSLAQKTNGGGIIVTKVKNTLPDNTVNHLHGRIGIGDTLTHINHEELNGYDHLHDITDRLKKPADLEPMRMTFKEKQTIIPEKVLF